MTVPVPRAACPVPARAHIQRRRRQRRRRRRRRRSLEDPHARTLMHVVITACAARNVCVLFALPVVPAMPGAPMPPGPSAVEFEPACRVASCRITGRDAVVAAGARLFPGPTRISRSGRMVRSDTSGGAGRVLLTKQVCRLFRLHQERDAPCNEMAMSRLGTMAREARETRDHVALTKAS